MSFGMHGMNRFFVAKKITYRRFSYVKPLFWIALSLFLFSFPSTFSYTVTSTDTFYTPATPLGCTSGFLGVDYEYTVFTTNPTTYWLFDWGDGTSSRWIQLTNGSTSITQNHLWTSAGIYQLRVQFKNEFFKNGVWSEPLPITINIAYSDDYPKTPTITSATILGVPNHSYLYVVVGTDPQEDTIQYRFDWGNSIYSEWTTVVRSGTRSVVNHLWTQPGNYSMKVQTRDQYWLTSPWSSQINVTIVPDSENEMTPVDVILLHGVYHRIESPPNQEKIFHNMTSGVSSVLQSYTGGTYLLDDNDDGRWDYVYDPSVGSIEQLETQPVITSKTSIQIPWLLLIILSIAVCSIIALVLLIKKGYIYVYEEVVVEK